jgi:TetR/AcrR family transcriptional regulator, transcriptional repressor for nem operon
MIQNGYHWPKFRVMAGRPKIFDETIALERAANLFWEKGYEATSTEDLIKVMGIQRGSFYNTFNSKKELFIKAINFHELNSFSELKKTLNESDNQVETLKMTFLSMAECGVDYEYKKGCFAGNTLIELSGIDEELANNARAHLKELESIFYHVIVRAKKNGQLKTQTESKILAKYLLTMWNGLNVTRRIYNDKKSLLPLIKLQLELVV